MSELSGLSAMSIGKKITDVSGNILVSTLRVWFYIRFKRSHLISIEDMWQHGLRIIVEHKKDYKTGRRKRFYYEKLASLYPSQNIIMTTKSRVQILCFWTLPIVLLLSKTPSCLYFKTQIRTSSIVCAQLSRFYLKTEIKSSLRNVVFWNLKRTVF
jgi:hypothetical protein